MASSSETKYFEVTVHHESIKSFSTALHLLQKIGKEITIGRNEVYLLYIIIKSKT